VLSLPFALRYLLATRPEVVTQVLGIVYRAISTHLNRKAGLTRANAVTGAVTLIQRFGISPAAVALFIVTRYSKSMKTTAGNRGRPRKDNALTAAERMRAYRKRKRDAGLKNVRRWELAEGVRQYSDHRILDARSLAMHCKITQKILRDPDLLDKARENLERWSAKSADLLPQYLHEWQEILKRPWPEIAEIITSMSEDATRLRSSSPFAGILTAEERDQIYAAFRA